MTWGCPLVVNYWADLQSVHRFHCYDNIAPNAKCQQVLVFVFMPGSVILTSLICGLVKPVKFLVMDSTCSCVKGSRCHCIGK